MVGLPRLGVCVFRSLLRGEIARKNDLAEVLSLGGTFVRGRVGVVDADGVLVGEIRQLAGVAITPAYHSLSRAVIICIYLLDSSE